MVNFAKILETVQIMHIRTRERLFYPHPHVQRSCKYNIFF